jgi:hypothetical protein
MSSQESNFSVTFKVNGDLFTVRGDDPATFRANLDTVILTDLAEKVLTAQQATQDAAGIAPAVATIQQSVAAPATAAPAPVYQAPPVEAAPAVAPAQGGVETVVDKWGNTWIYGLPQAPALPDGRGNYALKQGKSKAGKPYKGWFDPSKGPKPFPQGAVEAPAVFGVE